MKSWWREVLARRPLWMNLLMFFCASMAFVYMPWDLFVKPVAEDQEVWLGFVLQGWAAKASEPLHWGIYAAGTYGFWRMRSWMWPWAAIYTAQVAVAMLLWSATSLAGLQGWLLGLITAAPFAALVFALWRSRAQFGKVGIPLNQRYGGWALITGASAGIGLEFAKALAARGISCVLAARRRGRLEALARELEQHYQVATRVVPVDLADPAGADLLSAAVDDLEIGLLVNNAGFGAAGLFAKQDRGRLRAMVNLNCLAPVLLTSQLLPAMRERGRGAVIIVGSIAGRQPVPLHGVYSATKVFDLFLGESLWVELRGTGVDVLVVEPGPTETEFQQMAGELGHPGEPPARVVEVALEALGRQPSVISGWVNWLRGNLARLLPRPLVVLLAGNVMAGYTPSEMR